jgi:hypothetical protein
MRESLKSTLRHGTRRRIGMAAFVLIEAMWLAAACALAGETTTPGAVPHFREATPVGNEFRERMAVAVRSVPEGVWHRLSHAGWQFRSAEFLVDAVPDLKGLRPRGWPAGTTWENTEAVHLASARLLVVAEKRRAANGQIVSNSRAAGVLRHEVGHALDMAGGGAWRYCSSAPAFVACYDRDVRRMPPELAERLRYYTQADAAGRQEAFAEAFGVLLGGGSDPDRAEDFQQAFPAVMEYVAKIVSTFRQQ